MSIVGRLIPGLYFELERIRFPDGELNMTLREVQELVAELDAECQKCWDAGSGSPVKAWAAFALRNPQEYIYPTDFAEVLGDTQELKFFMAQRHLCILEAGLLPTADDTICIGIEWARGKGFVIKGGFFDSLSKSISGRNAFCELKIANASQLSIAMVRPHDAVKAWKNEWSANASRAARLDAEEGGWRQSGPGIKQSVDEHADKIGQQVVAELTYMQRRQMLNMPPDPGAGTKVGELLQQQAEAERDRLPDAARIKEIWEDLEFYNKRQAVMKEWDLAMPPDPEGLNEALQKCTETLQMTREMQSRFIKLGRTDKPVPFSFHWKLPEEPESGVLFIIRFNELDGPIGTRNLRMDAIPIRACIAPQKAVAEWKALCEREFISTTTPASQ